MFGDNFIFALDADENVPALKDMFQHVGLRLFKIKVFKSACWPESFANISGDTSPSLPPFCIFNGFGSVYFEM